MKSTKKSSRVDISVLSSVETERKIFEFEQNEQQDFRAERVSSKIYGIQFSSRASSSKKFSSAQKHRAKPERARAIFRAQNSDFERAKTIFFRAYLTFLTKIIPF